MMTENLIQELSSDDNKKSRGIETKEPVSHESLLRVECFVLLSSYLNVHRFFVRFLGGNSTLMTLR